MQRITTVAWSSCQVGSEQGLKRVDCRPEMELAKHEKDSQFMRGNGARRAQAEAAVADRPDLESVQFLARSAVGKPRKREDRKPKGNGDFNQKYLHLHLFSSEAGRQKAERQWRRLGVLVLLIMAISWKREDRKPKGN